MQSASEIGETNAQQASRAGCDHRTEKNASDTE
jgi:hypothetical protein